MEHHHGHDRAGTHPVERGEIGQTSVRDRALVVLHGAHPSSVALGRHRTWVAGDTHSRRTGPAPLGAALARYPDASLSPSRPLARSPPTPPCPARATAVSVAFVLVLVVLGAGACRGAAHFDHGPPLSPLRARIVAIAQGQVGYRTDPSDTYCNKFSAYWNAGVGRLRQRQPRRGVVRRLRRLGVEAGRRRGRLPAGAGLPQRRLGQLLRLGHRPRHLAPRRIGLHAPTGRRRRLRARHRGGHRRPRGHRHGGHRQRRRPRRHQRRRRPHRLQRGRGRRPPGLRRREAGRGRPCRATCRRRRPTAPSTSS